MDMSPFRRRAAAVLLDIRQVRTATQEDLAADLNVSSQAIRFWEQGKSEPRLSQFVALCQSLGMEAHAVLKAIEHPEVSRPPEDIEAMRSALCRFLQEEADADFIRSAYQMTFRLRRPSIMQLFLAYLALPLHRQQRNAWSIMDDWVFADRAGDLREDVPRPNIEVLRKAHQIGRDAALEGANDYRDSGK